MVFPDDDNINTLEKEKFRDIAGEKYVAVTGSTTASGAECVIATLSTSTESVDGTTAVEVTATTDQIFLRLESEEPDGRWYWGATQAQAEARKHWFTKFRPLAGPVNTSIWVIRGTGEAAANLTVWRGTST